MTNTLSKLKSRKRKRVSLSPEALVEERFVQPDMSLPVVFQSKISGLNLAQWVGENQDRIYSALDKSGGILFRGFSVSNIEHFQAGIETLWGDLLNYTERSSPRHSVKGNVYTSTDYPPEVPIFLHNEQSYNINWPRIIAFYCQTEPKDRGQTPIADTRRIYAKIDPEIRTRFEEKGYIYMRNFGHGLGLTWQEAFGTEDKAVVEAYCRKNQIEFEWKSDNGLRTWQKRRMVHKHPVTGDIVWFNHCTFFHVSTLPEAVHKNLVAEFAERDLPNQTFYGDGSSIEPEVIAHLQKVYLEEKVLFDWLEGDVLMLDNMLSCHGREPFSGARKILVSMAAPIQEQSAKLV